MKAPFAPPWPQPWTMSETRHMWVTFHQRYTHDWLIVIDLLSIEAILQDHDHSVIHTGPHHAYQIHESIEEVMAIMRKHLDKVT
jgi:hypothetical protein